MICQICLDEIEYDNQKLLCSHSFHKKCIINWLIINSSCPICRTPHNINIILENLYDDEIVLINAVIRIIQINIEDLRNDRELIYYNRFIFKFVLVLSIILLLCNYDLILLLKIIFNYSNNVFNFLIIILNILCKFIFLIFLCILKKMNIISVTIDKKIYYLFIFYLIFNYFII